ncbi:MAG: hypothetical protein P8Z70_09040 [Desulfuromonadales bacterium]
MRSVGTALQGDLRRIVDQEKGAGGPADFAEPAGDGNLGRGWQGLVPVLDDPRAAVQRLLHLG